MENNCKRVSVAIASAIYGEANTAENIKADEETVYEWGSISKVLVWTFLMMSLLL